MSLLFCSCVFSELTPCTASPHPCNNNGNCTAKEEDESVECKCFEGWQGNSCEKGEFDLATVKDGSLYQCVFHLTSFFSFKYWIIGKNSLFLIRPDGKKSKLLNKCFLILNVYFSSKPD